MQLPCTDILSILSKSISSLQLQSWCGDLSLSMSRTSWLSALRKPIVINSNMSLFFKISSLNWGSKIKHPWWRLAALMNSIQPWPIASFDDWKRGIFFLWATTGYVYKSAPFYIVNSYWCSDIYLSLSIFIWGNLTWIPEDISCFLARLKWYPGMEVTS